ncbi:PREDICTED: uncharacterized protein LOC107352250 [Acropora digitifera]|uniref:uncharacterized protein LOC107352250 n=1 Tax=Acropora digitifera TaxID=70779 RepID=UPI00077B1552|nr:PREDICTED: uncharacterized protein LOC107352250 [Acropora digitifera]
MQIGEFILTAKQWSDLGKRLLRFSYFDSQWLKEVFYHPISDTHELCFLKSCVKKINGTVEAAYCTCFAGLGSTCNHVAAVLFKVEHAWKSGLRLGNSPTSKECA